jgi:hypothetical protein
VFGLADDSNFSIFRFDLLKLSAERTRTDGDDWNSYPPDRRLHARSLEVRPSLPQDHASPNTAYLAYFGEFISLVLDMPDNNAGPDAPFHGYKAMLALNGLVYGDESDEEKQFKGKPVPV